MNANDPSVLNVLHRSMVARIATLSRNGRPSITPLYFVCLDGHIWLSTADWTLAARDAKADPRQSVLFQVEQNPYDRRILRITGEATVRTDPAAQRTNVLRVIFKYSLTPGGIRNNLMHLGQITLMNRYHAQSADKGVPCIIEVTPHQAEFLTYL